MAVTTTQLTSRLLKQIQSDFPALDFAPGDIFYWSSQNNTIHYGDINGPSAGALLLHEISHAVLKHKEYSFDIDLLRLEAAAWDHTAQTLGPKYALSIDESLVDESLNSYQHWLFERSLCPNCQQTGAQQTKNTYQCINCRCLWRVNDAKVCALRRIRLYQP